MIVGLGMDSVDIERFKHFLHYSPSQLSRIFSTKEIIYCSTEPYKSAERFAVRFAAKEALYKALSHANNKPTLSFLTLCSLSSIENNPIPNFSVNWKKLGLPTYSILVTLTHDKKTASAIVLLQKI